MGKSLSHRLFLSLTLSLTTVFTVAQNEASLKELFLEAESFFLFEEYKDALPLYQRILKAEPENYNVRYKIGVCFLRDKFNNEKSIQYLEEASEHATLNYRQNNFREKQAPFEVHFYLGDAYRVNNKLDKALASYRFFLDEMDASVYDKRMVEQRIESTQYAQKAMQSPVYFEKVNLGDKINTRFIERNAVISGDGKTLVFTRELQFYDAVFISRKKDGEWTAPINLTPEFTLDGNSYSTGISYDGNEIFIYRSDEYIGNIYSSRFVNGRWSVLKKLNDKINTKYWESHASVSADGQKLVFTSNRKGGYGELDIYISEKNERGEWGPATNLGSTINTPFNEESPFLSHNGERLYFSSQGHNNMGGYDVFRSNKLPDGSWSKPENLGYPINTTDDDMFYCPFDKGHFGLYSMHDKEGYGLDDIVMIEIFSDLHRRDIEMLVTLTPDREIPDEIRSNIQVTIRDRDGKELMDVTRLESEKDEVLFNIPHGEYQMIVEGPGIQTHTQQINIPVDHEGSTFNVKTPLLVSEAARDISKRELRRSEPPELQSSFDSLMVTSNERITLQFKLDRNTKLKVSHINNRQTIETTSPQITGKTFDYTFAPLPGVNYIEAIAEDDQGNITKKVIRVVYHPEKEKEEPAPEMDTIQYFTEVENIYEFLETHGSETVQMAMEEVRRFKINDINNIYKELSLLANEEFFAQSEIDSLFALYYSKKSTAQFLHELQLSAKGNLAMALETTDLQEDNIQSHTDLLNYLRSERFGHAFNDYDLLHAFSVLMANNDSSRLNEFHRMLTNHARGNLKSALEQISLENNNIYTPLNLLTHLYDNNQAWQFTHNELFGLLLELSSTYDVDDLYLDMLYFSEGELYNYLLEAGKELGNYRTARAFIQHLLEQSRFKPYEASDVINTLMKAREHEINATLIKEILSNNAKGSLKRYIIDTKAEKLQALGFQGYINDILANSSGNAYEFTDVIEMLLSVIGYEDTEQFIDQFQLFASQHLSDFIDQIRDQRFRSPSHFVKFLLEEAEKQNYSRQDVIDTLIKLAYLNICQLVKGDKDISRELPSKGITGLFVLLALLVILIFFMYRRRKRKQQNSN